MNTVFYMLRNEFEADESYSGADIMSVVLKTIKVSFEITFWFRGSVHKLHVLLFEWNPTFLSLQG